MPPSLIAYLFFAGVFIAAAVVFFVPMPWRQLTGKSRKKNIIESAKRDAQFFWRLSMDPNHKRASDEHTLVSEVDMNEKEFKLFLKTREDSLYRMAEAERHDGRVLHSSLELRKAEERIQAEIEKLRDND